LADLRGASRVTYPSWLTPVVGIATTPSTSTTGSVWACLDARLDKACAGLWRGVISPGFAPDGKRIRRKVSGQSKADVKTRLGALHDELHEGLHTSATCTVREAVEDWLANGSRRTVGEDRLSQAPGLDGASGQVGVWPECLP
jgi:hypothetical protein